MADRTCPLCRVMALEARHARAVDDQDTLLLRSTLADDVSFLGGDGQRREGVEECVAYFERYWRSAPDGGTHLVTNVEVLANGQNLVEVSAYFLAAMTSAEGRCRQTWGRYEDIVVEDGTGALVLARRDIVVHGRTGWLENDADR